MPGSKLVDGDIFSVCADARTAASRIRERSADFSAAASLSVACRRRCSASVFRGDCRLHLTQGGLLQRQEERRPPDGIGIEFAEVGRTLGQSASKATICRSRASSSRERSPSFPSSWASRSLHFRVAPQGLNNEVGTCGDRSG